jgi:hypothetical protein
MSRTIVFHGAKDEQAASDIWRYGFKEGTYFARHLEDALEFGGEWVFAVALEDPVPDHWQIHTNIVIPREQVVWLRRYKVVELFVNETLRKAVFEEASPEG